MGLRGGENGGRKKLSARHPRARPEDLTTLKLLKWLMGRASSDRRVEFVEPA